MGNCVCGVLEQILGICVPVPLGDHDLNDAISTKK